MAFNFGTKISFFVLYKSGIKINEKNEVATTLKAAKIAKSCNASDLIKNKHKKVIPVVIPQSMSGFEMSLYNN